MMGLCLRGILPLCLPSGIFNRVLTPTVIDNNLPSGQSMKFAFRFPSLPLKAGQPRPATLVSQRGLLFGLLALVVGVTGVGIWNEQHQPKASFKISAQDLAPDPLAPASPDVLASATAASTSAASAAPSSPAPPRVRIVAKDVNMRSQPSRQAPVVARPALHEEFLLSGERRQAEGLDWVQLKLPDGKLAWISSRFVEPLTAPAVEQPKDEVEAAAQVVSQLLMAPGLAWSQAPDALRQLTSQALLRQIFKDRPAAITPGHAPALDACIKASAAEKKLAGLKVYELATACALALGWR